MYHGHNNHAFSFSQELNGGRDDFFTFSFYGHIGSASRRRAMNFKIKKES